MPVTSAARVAVLLAAASAGRAAAAPPPSKDACVAAYVEAQHARRDGALRRAREQLLVCAQPECPIVLQRDCLPWLTEVEQLVPTIVFVVRDANGRDLGEVAVNMDGKPLVSRLDGLPVDVDPGEHVFRFDAAGFAGIEQRVLVQEGEKARRVVVTLPTTRAPVAPSRVSASTSTSAARTRRPLTPMCWISLGAGTLALATSAVVGATSLPTWLRCHHGGCTMADKEHADHLNTIGDVALATGVVGALAAWYFLHTRPTVTIEPVGTTGGTLQFRTTF